MRKLLLIIVCMTLLQGIVPFGTAAPADTVTTGSVTENGDQYWDSGEYDFYSIELFFEEQLDISFSGSGAIELMLCSCNSPEDIDDILSDTLFGSGSPDLFLWIDNYSITAGTYVAQGHVNLNIAVFSYSSDNPSSMNYQITTSHPLGERYSNSETITGDIDGVIGENEYSSYLFEMNGGRLDIRVSSDNPIQVIACSCEDSALVLQDIEDENLSDGNYNYFTLNVDGYNGITLSINGRVDVYVYVYTLNHGSVSQLTYYLYTNRAEGDTINDDTGGSSSGNGLFGIIFLVIIIVIVAIVVYDRRRDRTPAQNRYNQGSYNYNPPPGGSQQQGYQQTYVNPDQSQQSQGRTCSNCGAANTTMFCTSCGEKM